jgi:hypothetical protein
VHLKQLLKFSRFSIVFLAVAGLSSCNLCKDEVVERVVSPDGKWAASIVTIDCGATTSENIIVNLQDAKQRRLDEENNIFVLNTFIHCIYHGRGITASQLTARTATWIRPRRNWESSAQFRSSIDEKK